MIKCKTCSQLLCFSITKGTKSIEAVSEVYAVYIKRLNEGHNSACFWRNNPCPKSLATITLRNRPEETRRFAQRARTIQHLLGSNDYDLPPGVEETLLADANEQTSVIAELSAFLRTHSTPHASSGSQVVVVNTAATDTPPANIVTRPVHTENSAELTSTPATTDSAQAITDKSPAIPGTASVATAMTPANSNSNATPALSNATERTSALVTASVLPANAQGKVPSTSSANKVMVQNSAISMSVPEAGVTTSSQTSNVSVRETLQSTTPLVLALAIAGWESDAGSSENNAGLVCRYCQRTLAIPVRPNTNLQIDSAGPAVSSGVKSAATGIVQTKSIENAAVDPINDIVGMQDTYKRRRLSDTTEDCRRVFVDPIYAHRTFCPWVQPVASAADQLERTLNTGWRVYRDFLLHLRGSPNGADGESSPSRAQISEHNAPATDLCARQAAERVLKFIHGVAVAGKRAVVAPVKMS
ncbi:hypothetical protein SARC_12925 [Sphaeroforma arctica JP610]|uniref:Uncharacterized protein n=1 Tax=Sphaeroforma arctica JP610 TaxID=667725 RepID=A0A0L0FCQ4_9EUKA|nr:hypothetical protein SARC_12925 [Sphaeroforma arctica JP610]KNC74534.1 hypothetical protein SARC_12925 [Sphaeroforma arctica JP610]|eukprot:XP_014148436.1 hypothetical protein SARC_12925 [Sphaeroforma arctica JP610]